MAEAPDAPDAPGPPERPRRTAAVRFRITALAALAVAAVLGGTGVALVAVQARVLTNSLDAALEQRAEDLAALVAAGPPSGTLPGGDDDVVAQVVDGEGRVLAASPALAGEPALRLPDDAGTGPVDVDIDGDSDHRALARPVDVPGGRATLYVVGEVDDIRESVTILATSLLVAVPVAVAALAALVWWLAGRTLRPVEAIRAEVAGMDGTDLGGRVPVPPSGDEVAQLARTMNGMLDRVEEASRRQQRFVADASHELRSPLARMRAELEVEDTHPVTSDPTVTRRSVLAEVVGLQRLVDDLLYLARADAEGGADALGAPRPVDLDDIVLAEAVGRRRSAGGDAPTLDTSAVTGAQVLGRRDDLARVVTNLVDNAVRHARSRVSLSLREDGDVAVLTVADDGSGIPPDQAEWVFGRFTRLDPARAGATGGTGLGLAIARDIVERHGGTIAVDAGMAAGARMVVTLPLAPAG